MTSPTIAVDNTVDEFTLYRLDKIATKFARYYKALGRKQASKYLEAQKIKPVHYPIMRKNIDAALSALGISLE